MVTIQKLIAINSSEVTHKINVENFIGDKIAAIQCHKTQTDVWHQLERIKPDFNSFAKWEVFVQKWPKPDTKSIKDDIFDS